jgi:hypothetical protein
MLHPTLKPPPGTFLHWAAQLQDALQQFVDYLQALWPALTKAERE